MLNAVHSLLKQTLAQFSFESLPWFTGYGGWFQFFPLQPPAPTSTTYFPSIDSCSGDLLAGLGFCSVFFSFGFSSDLAAFFGGGGGGAGFAAGFEFALVFSSAFGAAFTLGLGGASSSLPRFYI